MEQRIVGLRATVEGSEELSSEERRLWADYYESLARVIDLIRREGTNGEVICRILAEDAIGSRALARIKEIRGVP
jgi:hypothetical protein